jgi:RNA polymerase sigma factor (sigma-70 family)
MGKRNIKGLTLEDYFQEAIPRLISQLHKKHGGSESGLEEGDLLHDAYEILLIQKQSYPNEDLKKAKQRLYQTIYREIPEKIQDTRNLFSYTSTMEVGGLTLDTLRHLNKKYQLTETKLQSQLGRSPSLEEMAVDLELPVDKVRSYLRQARTILESDLSPKDLLLRNWVSSQENGPEQNYDNQQFYHQVRKLLGTLTMREEKIMRLRFGIGERTDANLDEVAQDLGETRERIRQIEAKALRKCRHPARAKLIRIWDEETV